jgi:predicted nucleotidyltransferase
MLAGFAADSVQQIRARLDLARQTGAKILFAMESGSRAWGFPSPDSDYDCRFIYIWPAEDHLVLNVQRDVIEFPIESEIDAGGWDLRKALLLALKGNAVIVEWVNSPHVYEEVDGFRASLKKLLAEIVEPSLVARHYVGLLRRHSPENTADVKLKRLFYALRPALSLQYMQERGFRELPPMDLGQLLESVTLSPDLRQLIDVMVETKKLTREMGTGPVPAPLTEYLDIAMANYADLTDRLDKPSPSDVTERYRVAQNFYRNTVLGASIG